MSQRGQHPNSRQNLTPFLPGNTAALKHGGYAKHFDPSLAQEVEDSDSGDNVERLESLIKLERLRMHSALEARASYHASDSYQQTRGADLPVIHHETHPGGAVTKRQRPDFEQAIDRSMGRLLSLISEQERLSASPAHVAAALCEVLDEAAAAGMSATDTAEQCERAGIEVPFSVQQRVRSELALAEPEETPGGMTDDELEALSEQYEESVESEEKWLAERRADVEQMHESKKGEKHGK